MQHFVRGQVSQSYFLAAAQRAECLLFIASQPVGSGSFGRIEVRPAVLIQEGAWELSKAYRALQALTLLSRLLVSPL